MTINIGKPNPKQALFLTDRHLYIGYGGARAGGKSWAIRAKATILGLRYKGIRQCIIRQTYGDLVRNHVEPLKKMLVEDWGVARYNTTEHQFRFNNGSPIDMVYCASDDDINHIQGIEYDVIYIDEATQLSEYQLKLIAASCRGANDFPKHVYFTCNPGGQGHAYIKRVFIDRKYEGKENPDDYTFIQATVDDNAVLQKYQPKYIDFLDSLPEKIRKAWRDGDWNVLSGMFFEEFRDDPEHYLDRAYTHVIEPFDIPRNWRIYRSYDYGYAKPFSVGWWAVDEEDRIYRILEWYGCTGIPNEGLKLTPDEQFAHIREVEEQHPYLRGRKIIGIADPAIFSADGGPSIAETAEKHGVYFSPGDNKRINGWMQFHYRLRFDENGIPMMYIFNTCKNFVRTIGLQMYDEHKVEDLDTTLEDHAMDDTRYMCMARPIRAIEEAEPVNYGDDPLNQRVRRAKRYYISHG